VYTTTLRYLVFVPVKTQLFLVIFHIQRKERPDDDPEIKGSKHVVLYQLILKNTKNSCVLTETKTRYLKSLCMYLFIYLFWPFKRVFRFEDCKHSFAFISQLLIRKCITIKGC